MYILQYVFVRLKIFKHLFMWFDYRNKTRHEQERYEL